MDCIVHGVAKSRTWLSDFDFSSQKFIVGFLSILLPIVQETVYLTWFHAQKYFLEDGGGIGRGDHFLPYKFMERTIERWENFTKQLLISSRGHQVPEKQPFVFKRR